MKHLIIGTAGHVDHGKTCLTKALTGVDTDRLKEEQKRGITIEIGFAQLTLPNGQRASIVDVPGHEKFVRNMLIGATGIDVVLLVVAADEGFMPQTQEHLEILSLLNIKNGIVVLTKTDMVDEDWVSVVTQDTRERLKGSFLENAPIVPVSAYTGRGLEELKQAIVQMVEDTAPRKPDRPCRLPVDRVFSMKGFGTVITGTLVDGRLHSGDTVMVYPRKQLARVRELQNHDEPQAEVEAGMRVAVNLTGLNREDIQRGCTIAAPDSMLLSKQIAVSIQLTPDATYEIKNSSTLHFHLGTQELVGRIRILNADTLKAGESGYAVLTFPEELAARNLDRFILRFFSPMITVGGGVVLDMDSPRLRRKEDDTLARLAQLGGTPRQRICQMVEDSGIHPTTEDHLRRHSGLSETVIRETVEALTDEKVLVHTEIGLLAASVLDELWKTADALLRDFHTQNPLQDGIPLGELRVRLFGTADKAFDPILDYFASIQKLRFAGSRGALYHFKCKFTPEQKSMQKKLDHFYRHMGFEPPLNADVAKKYPDRQKDYTQVILKMTKEGTLLPLTPQTSTHRAVCQKAWEELLAMFSESETVTLGDFRTRLGVSRKFTQMFLDYFDRLKLTKLVGDHRILLKADYQF